MIKYMPVPFFWFPSTVIILHNLIVVISTTHIAIIWNRRRARNVSAILFTFSFPNVLILWLSISCTGLCKVVMKKTGWLSIHTWARMRPFILHSSLPHGKPHFDLCYNTFWKTTSVSTSIHSYMFYYHTNITIALLLYSSCWDIVYIALIQ